MPNTITTDTATYELPAGLSDRQVEGCPSYRCDDCGTWAHAGDRLRHSRRCDTPHLQAREIGAALPKPRFHQAKGGKLVVKGLVQDVYAGATLEIDGQAVTIASCGRSWVEGDHEWVYGYLAETEAQRAATGARECLECGAVEGEAAKWVHAHGMGCSRCE